MNNQPNQENTNFNDNDSKLEKSLQSGAQEQQKLKPGVTSDDDENAGGVYSENLMNKAESQVRATEDASLQDDTYSFDEDNTSNEEYHDAGDAEDFDLDNDDDFIH